jgi:uncharacterized protein (PEP-CTERM system associated)
MVITRATRKPDPPLQGRAGRRIACSFTSRNATHIARKSIAAVTFAAAAGASPALAQTWRTTPSIAWESTLTNNVALTANRQSDWVNQITPAIRFDEVGSHTRLSGSVALPILLYARTSENNYVAPTVNVAGTLEAVERLFFIDASLSAAPQYASPFGAHPTDLSNATQNRYTSQTYSVSPYIKGNLPGYVDYELRDTNTWTVANAAALDGGRSYTNDVAGHVTHQPKPLGWEVTYDRSDIKFTGRESEITEIERIRGLYAPDLTLRLSASVGYEDNRLFLTRESGATYGVGIRWRPTERTTLDANYEHRFFGASYDATFDHRTPLSVWSIRASRDISSYPQQLGRFGEGIDVGRFLNALLVSRIPDPTQRQTIVDQIIRDRGLPGTLTSPIALFAQQVTLVETEQATAGILGARNSVFFTVFRSRDQPLETSNDLGLSNLATTIQDTTQIGANIAWTRQLAPNLSLATSVDWSRATSNVVNGERTRQFIANAILTSSLSPRLSIHGGARFQQSRSNIAEDFTEAAVFFGATYLFR